MSYLFQYSRKDDTKYRVNKGGMSNTEFDNWKQSECETEGEKESDIIHLCARRSKLNAMAHSA